MADEAEERRVVVSSIFAGIFSMQLCAVPDVTDEELLEVANRENPAGTEHGWMHVVRNDTEYPRRNPVACNQYPARTHFLVDC